MAHFVRETVHVEIPQSLRGRGEVDVTLMLQGQLSTKVKVNFK